MVNCPICLNNIENSNVNTPCGHKFCYNCFVTHFTSGNSYSRNCPVCRSELCSESTQLIPINQQIIQSPSIVTFFDLPLAYFDMNTPHRYNSTTTPEPTPIPSQSSQPTSTEPTQPISTEPTQPTQPTPTESSHTTPTEPTQPTNYGYRYNSIFYNTLQHMNGVDQWTINILRDWVSQDNDSYTDQDTETEHDEYYDDPDDDPDDDTDDDPDDDTDDDPDYDLLI